MPNYRFTGLTPRFYPDERGDDGRSLMALPGDVHNWDRTPDDGQWTLAGDAPELPQEAPETPAVPADPPAVPDPAPAPVVPAEPVPAPVPEAAPQPAMTAGWFAGLANLPARA